MFDLSASVSDHHVLVHCPLTLGSTAIHWNIYVAKSCIEKFFQIPPVTVSESSLYVFVLYSIIGIKGAGLSALPIAKRATM